jgi:hypothetical protein
VADLQVGDTIYCRFGPYTTTAEVVEVKDAGAVLKYADTAKFEPNLTHDTVSPDGKKVLAPAPYGFLGRAHWPSVMVAD